jgi:hypothetical protein
MNALQREHADLGRRAAWRGKTTNLTAGRQDPQPDDLRHRGRLLRRPEFPGADFIRLGGVDAPVAGTAAGYCALLASALLKARVETAAVFARAEKRRCPIAASVFPFGLARPGR